MTERNFCIAVAPFLNVFPSNQRIVVDGNVTWRCRATADPAATVTWQKDGIDVVESDAISVSPDGGELTVLNLHPEDTGRYTCVASNYVGSVHASAHLLVIGNLSRVCRCVSMFIVEFSFRQSLLQLRVPSRKWMDCWEAPCICLAAHEESPIPS